jgi:hypothetical protein
MNLFYRPKYESEITQFLKTLKANNPAIAEGQRQGRSLLWDKTVDREAAEQFREARVAQQPYVYQSAGE